MEPWFKEWFESPDYLTVYSHRDDEDAGKLTELILRNIKLSPNSKALDAGCGAGRYILKFTNAGFKTFGFDLSSTLLHKAKDALLEKGIPVNIFRSDIRNVSVKKEFHLVLNLFTSFGYFDSDEENFSFIKDAKEFLLPDGYYVFDYFNKNYLVNNLIPASSRETGAYSIKETRSIINERVVKQIEISSNGQVNKFEESVRIYDPSTIIRNFITNGYTLDKLFGNYDGDDFNELNSERFIAIFKA